MTTDSLPEKWNEIKGDIRNKWDKLTHDELDRTKGNIEAIGRLIQRRYGRTKDDVSEKLNAIFDKGTKAAADVTENAKNKLREADDTHA
jgi:uncharacterized protein YjbJ (UPF0337 family)